VRVTFLAPSLLSSLDQGVSMVDCMNAIGVTHVSIGNHEADVSLHALRERIQQSNFVWINTNMPTLNQTLETTTVTPDHVTTCTDAAPPYTVPFCMVPVGSSSSKRVGLLGLLTHDPSLYRPNAFGGAPITPLVTATSNILDERQNNDTKAAIANVDLLLPLTHQGIVDDRRFAAQFGGTVFPVVCGGHDHEVYHETVNGTCIVKAGMDAANAAIIDVQWWDNTDQMMVPSLDGPPPPSNPTVRVEIVPTTNFEPDSDMLHRVQSHQQVLKELERAKLFPIADWMLCHARHRRRRRLEQAAARQLHHDAAVIQHPEEHHEDEQPALFSTANNRLGPSSGTTALCTMLRMGMRAQCAVINAGAIRGGQVYAPDAHFTWSHLKAEIPFPTPLTACYIPGAVLQDTIRHSRLGAHMDPPRASGGYLHTCSNIELHPRSDEILYIRDKEFDPDQMYLTALPAQFFAGIDNHQPLLDWAATQLQGEHAAEALELFSEESAIPAKMVLVQVFAASMWLRMGRFDEIDRNHDGVLTRDEVRARIATLFGHESVADLIVDNIFSVADMNKDGKITPLEMMICQFVATDIMDHVVTQQELVTMKEIAAHVLGQDPSHAQVKDMVIKIRNAMDLQGDGTINRIEAMNALGSLQRSELLN
jgi:2',3'-cyclic-nucleotide 2'-phosphodiesterase (5'-nucleotidase family)